MSGGSPSRAKLGDRMHSARVAGEAGAVPWSDVKASLMENQNRLGALQLLASVSDYEPLPHQLRAHLSTSRHKLFLGGVGSGKSTWSMAEAIVLSLLNPAGCTGVVLGPTYDIVTQVLLPTWLAFAESLNAAGIPFLRRYNKSQAKADLEDGSSVLFRSFHKADSIRGLNATFACLDEVAVDSNPNYVWDVIAGRLRDPRSNVIQLHATTTPKGLINIPALFHKMSQTDARPEWWVGRATSMENPHLPPGFIESLKQGYSKRQWEQEVLGKCLQAESTVWPEIDKNRHVIPWTYDPTLPYWMGMDFGYAKPAIIFAQEHRGSLVLFWEYVEDEVPYEKQKAVILNKIRELGKPPEHVVGDRADREWMGWLIHTLSRSQVHRMKTKMDQRVTTGIEVVRTMLDPMVGEPRLYVAQNLTKDPPERGIWRAFHNYRWKLTRDGLIGDTALKDGKFDHICDPVRWLAIVFNSDKTGPSMISKSDYGNLSSRRDHNRKHRRPRR